MTTEITLSHLSRPEWLAMRKLGSSDAAAICGLNPWRTPFAVWAEKVGLYHATAEGEAIWWGNKLEAVIAEGFAERTSLVIQKCQTMFVHSPHDMLTATPDFLVTDDATGLLEIKNVGVRGGHAWEDGIPDSVHIQAAHQMLVTGYPFAYVAGLIGGNKLVWKRIERTPRLEEILLGTLLSFWEMVLTKTPPPAQANDTEVLAALYPESSPASVVLSQDTKALADAYQEARAREREAAADADMAANRLKLMLGEAERGEGPGFRVTWKTQNRKGYEVKPTSFRKFQIMEVTKNGKDD